MPEYIRITAVPPGEAPLWVRQKWVGLCLPVADSSGAHQAYVSGVLSGPRNQFLALAWRLFGKLGRQSGYAVYVRDAVRELEKSAPDAAAWWRQDAPRLQTPGRKFLFQTPYCEPMRPGCDAGHQGTVSTPSVAPPSTVAQTPMGRGHRFPLAPALILALVLFGGLWNWSHPTRPERQVQIQGRLVDWSLHNYSSKGGSHTTVHLRITGYSPEFRIDPGIFHDLMGNRLPVGFTDGATIDITADAKELASPLHAPLEPGVAFVWVDGLAVNGATAFALNDVVQDERHQWTGWFGLAAMATAYLAFRIINSRK